MNKDKYYYFNLGAESMKTEILVRFMIDNKQTEANKVMSMPTPKFQEPEEMRVESNKIV